MASQLGLPDLKANPFHIKACVAKAMVGQPPDPRLHEGLRWLLGSVGGMFPELDARVQRDTMEVRYGEGRRERIEGGLSAPLFFTA